MLHFLGIFARKRVLHKVRVLSHVIHLKFAFIDVKLVPSSPTVLKDHSEHSIKFGFGNCVAPANELPLFSDQFHR